MKEENEPDDMTPEEINEAYFVCSECKQLAERGRLGMEHGYFMCSVCGHTHKEGAML